MTLFAGIAAAVAGCVVCGTIFFVVVSIIVMIVVFIRKAQSKGVVFKDGIDEAEWGVVREAVAETMQAEAVRASLGKVVDAVQIAIAKKATK